MSSEIGQAICPIHVAPGEGQAIWAMSSLFEIKLDAAASGGSLTVMEVANARFPAFVKLLLRHFPTMAPLVRKYILAVKQLEQEKAKRDWDEVDDLLAEAEARTVKAA